ncbi:MAG: hypothetical protein AAF547_02810 [Actinomycetota bacterium]
MQLPWAEQLRRLPRLVVGLVVFGAGVACAIAGDWGLPGWDVFHQGLAEQTPLTIGQATIAVGAVLLLAMVALREPIGVGTVGNVLLIGLSVDATLWLLDEPSDPVVRAGLTLVGPLVVAVGSGLYLGVRLGSGPRDGIMTALDRRGVTLWKARFGIEAAALVAGVILGGTIGWGTIWFLVIIGPAVQAALRVLSVPLAAGEQVNQAEPGAGDPGRE